MVAWYKLAESCFENIQKGSAVIIDGELQSRSWRNDDGSSRNVVEIKARRIQFLNRKDGQREELETEEFSKLDEKFADVKAETMIEEMPGEEPMPGADEISTEEDQDKEEKDYDFGYSNLNL